MVTCGSLGGRVQGVRGEGAAAGARRCSVGVEFRAVSPPEPPWLGGRGWALMTRTQSCCLIQFVSWFTKSK